MEARISCAVVPMSQLRPRTRVPALRASVSFCSGRNEEGTYEAIMVLKLALRSPAMMRIDTTYQSDMMIESSLPRTSAAHWERKRRQNAPSDSRVDIAHRVGEGESLAMDIEASTHVNEDQSLTERRRGGRNSRHLNLLQRRIPIRVPIKDRKSLSSHQLHPPRASKSRTHPLRRIPILEQPAHVLEDQAIPVARRKRVKDSPRQLLGLVRRSKRSGDH